MLGLHLTADLLGCGCPADRLIHPEQIAPYARRATERVGLSVVAEKWHRFPGAPGGVTGVLLLAESHLAIHTWPEFSNVTLDVFVCNYSGDNSAKAERLFEALLAWFEPEQTLTHRLQRGEERLTR